MDRSRVLSEKVRRPTQVGLSRARLERPLLAENGPGLTLVCAPAGSGKSTLLTTVASQASFPVAWYRVTVDDATPSALVAHLGATLDRCLDVPGARAARDVKDLLSALDNVSALDKVSALDNGERPCLLVLDDLHEIIGSAAEKALETFLSLRPREIRVALGCRRQPELNLPLLRAGGAIHEVTADDLRFRVWEVEELFTVVHGEPLSPETAAALTRRTGGWAAGLQLFHLANSRKSGFARQQAVTAMSARSRLIRGYLARNVLDGLSEQRRHFLVQTCALGLLSGPLCDALLGTTGSAQVLEELERDQLFTSSLDDGLTFSYHEVLQRHLELALVLDRGTDGARRWYARCAGLLIEAGAYREALRAYALAEDWRSVAELVQRKSADVTTAIATSSDHLLPTRLLRDDPWLALADARRRLRRGAVADAVAAFKHAESLLDEPRFRSSCAAEWSAAASWSEESEPRADGPDGRRPVVWTDRLRALTRAAAPSRDGAPHADVRTQHDDEREVLLSGVASLMAGRFGSASALFAHVVLTTPDVTMPKLAAQLGGVVADLADGHGGDCPSRLEEITVDAEAAGYPWIERLARGLHAVVLAVSSAAPWRLDACAELLVECEREGDRWGAALLQLASAVAAGLVRHPVARERFAAAAAGFRALDAAVLAGWADTLAQRWAACPPASSALTHSQLPVVRVRCFGGFEISVDGRAIELSELRPRALTLLRLLALDHDRNVHRERLIDALWPDASLAVGARRLQVAISSIRHVLQGSALGDGDLVRRSGDSYRLLVPSAEVDVQVFEQLLAEASAERDVGRRVALRCSAVDIYTGDLFPEEGPADHVVGERDRLRLAAGRAACVLGSDHFAAGQYDDAVAAARRSVELDRYQDIAWQLLADALARSGDESASTRARLEHLRIRAELADQTWRAGSDLVAETPDSTTRAAVERSLSVR